MAGSVDIVTIIIVVTVACGGLFGLVLPYYIRWDCQMSRNNTCIVRFKCTDPVQSTPRRD